MGTRPIRFSCSAILPASPVQIAERIARVESWCEFRGYGPIPGIASAVYELRTAELKGSRIRVRNEDRSHHVEEITEWAPNERVVLQLGEFSPPLSSLASRFVEEWEFTPVPEGTRATRSFSLYPRNSLTRLPLWVISRMLRRAAAEHLRHMKSVPAGA
jgi:hypothetical protein